MAGAKGRLAEADQVMSELEEKVAGTGGHFLSLLRPHPEVATGTDVLRHVEGAI